MRKIFKVDGREISIKYGDTKFNDNNLSLHNNYNATIIENNLLMHLTTHLFNSKLSNICLILKLYLYVTIPVRV